MKLTREGVYIVDSDSHISKWIEERGALEDPNFAPFVEKFLKPGDWVVDGGAFVGDSAATFARLVGPTGRVHAFEPNREAFACLEKNCPGVSAYLKGLSDDFGFSSIHELENAGASYLNGSEGPVDLWPIDHLHLEKCALIKLDLEGYEVRALLGARATIKRCRPVLVIEVNVGALARVGNIPLDIFLLLDSLGYKYRNLYPDQPMKGDQYDIIAEPI